MIYMYASIYADMHKYMCTSIMHKYMCTSIIKIISLLFLFSFHFYILVLLPPYFIILLCSCFLTPDIFVCFDIFII